MALEQKLDFKTVYKTNTAFGWAEGNPEKPHGSVVSTDAEFQDLISRLRLPFSFEGEPFKSKAIPHFKAEYNTDFSKEMVVAVFQGQRTSGGYSIEITDIVESDNFIIVSATAIEPSGGMATANLTYPAHFVACKKSEKPVELSVTVRDTYAEELANCKRYMVSPKEREHPPELDTSAQTNRADRLDIIKRISAKVYDQLKKDCEQIGLPTDFAFLKAMGTAFMDLEDTQVKELEKRGYDVFKAV